MPRHPLVLAAFDEPLRFSLGRKSQTTLSSRKAQLAHLSTEGEIKNKAEPQKLTAARVDPHRVQHAALAIT